MTSYGNNSIMTSNNGTSTLGLTGNLLINTGSSPIIGIQFGTAGGSTTTTTNFNKPFPSANIVVNTTYNTVFGNNGIVNMPVISSVTKDSFTWTPYYGNPSTGIISTTTYTISWMAVCYA